MTYVALLPHVLYDVINYPNITGIKFPMLRMLVTGGSMIPDSLLRITAEVFDTHVFRAYGSAENLGMALMHDFDSPLDLTITSDGYPCYGCEVKIVNEQDHAVPVGTCGELFLRSSHLFLYYLGDDEKTREVKKPDGWFHSGDLAVMDERGYCRIVGRKKDTIV